MGVTSSVAPVVSVGASVGRTAPGEGVAAGEDVGSGVTFGAAVSSSVSVSVDLSAARDSGGVCTGNVS